MINSGEVPGVVNVPVNVAVAAPVTEIHKSGSPLLKVLVVCGTLVLLLGAAGFGLWRVVKNGKNEIKVLAGKQTEQVSNLEQNLNQIAALYKDTDSKGTGENTNAVVLGASISNEEGQRVLGMEDDPAVIKERNRMSKLQDGRALIEVIRKSDTEIKSHNSSPIVIFLPKDNPVEKTEKFLTDFDRIYDYFQRSADRDIRSTALGFNLGVALQMALTTPDEPSIQRLSNVINDFQNMVTEEKNTDTSNLPVELVSLHEKTVKADGDMIATVANLPGLFRQKNLQGIKDNLKTFLTNAVMTGAAGEIDLVTFWQGNATVRSLTDIKKSWQDYSNSL